MRNQIVNKAIENRIMVLRGEYVMFSHDLAELYAVETYRLNEAVKRNKDRFPADFMFQITQAEYDEILKSQIAISSWGGARRALPYAFTEQGISMLSSVLNSDRAVRINIEIMRTFVAYRKHIFTQREILSKLENLTNKITLMDRKVNRQGEVMKDIILFTQTVH